MRKREYTALYRFLGSLLSHEGAQSVFLILFHAIPHNEITLINYPNAN